MKKNMGNIDRIIRILVAVSVALLVYFQVVSGIAAYILIAIAAVFVLTSMINFCPLYNLFGISSCKIKKTK